MSDAFRRYAAHQVVALRGLLILVVVWLFRMPSLRHRIAALLDTLADRITENVMMVLFAADGMIPLGIAVFVIARSLSADFVRALNFQKGIGTFAINTSPWGRVLVASPFSRAFYLGIKCMLFILGGLTLVIQASDFPVRDRFLSLSGRGLYCLAYIVLLCSAVRFGLLLYDSRNTLRDHLAAR